MGHMLLAFYVDFMHVMVLSDSSISKLNREHGGLLLGMRSLLYASHAREPLLTVHRGSQNNPTEGTPKSNPLRAGGGL